MNIIILISSNGTRIHINSIKEFCNNLQIKLFYLKFQFHFFENSFQTFFMNMIDKMSNRFMKSVETS